MSRNKNKGKFFKSDIKSKKKLIFYNKSVIIIPEYINKFIKIYNGKSFINLKITNKMIGFKLGEFIYTKKRHIYKTKNNKKWVKK